MVSFKEIVIFKIHQQIYFANPAQFLIIFCVTSLQRSLFSDGLVSTLFTANYIKDDYAEPQISTISMSIAFFHVKVIQKFTIAQS